MSKKMFKEHLPTVPAPLAHMLSASAGEIVSCLLYFLFLQYLLFLTSFVVQNACLVRVPTEVLYACNCITVLETAQ